MSNTAGATSSAAAEEAGDAGGQLARRLMQAADEGACRGRQIQGEDLGD